IICSQQRHQQRLPPTSAQQAMAMETSWWSNGEYPQMMDSSQCPQMMDDPAALNMMMVNPCYATWGPAPCSPWMMMGSVGRGNEMIGEEQEQLSAMIQEQFDANHGGH
ncbi:unnamed protein product, partial [Amoebophrya sp. A25]